MRHTVVWYLIPLLVSGVAAAQEPSRPDSASQDTSQAAHLPEINVTVTRTEEPLSRVPYAVGVLNRGDLRRGRQTIGLDEALNDLPGVVVANRYNFSLDQRISIRGFGSRANFGVRGVKVLLDGVPQTLPDGQSQLTNVEFGVIDRAEVRRRRQSPSASGYKGARARGTTTISTNGRAGPPGARGR